MICRHCNRVKANRPRGLCWKCFYTPGVRELCPPLSKYARQGIGQGGASRPAGAPTAARPGTAAKLAELARRCEAGEELWHEGDQDWTVQELTAAGTPPREDNADDD